MTDNAIDREAVDLTAASLAQYLIKDSEQAMGLAQKLQDLLVAEQANPELSLGALAMVVKSVADSFGDDESSPTHCIATGMLAANISLEMQPKEELS